MMKYCLALIGLMVLASTSVAVDEPMAWAKIVEMEMARLNCNASSTQAANDWSAAQSYKTQALADYAAYKTAHGGAGDATVDAMLVDAGLSMSDGDTQWGWGGLDYGIGFSDRESVCILYDQQNWGGAWSLAVTALGKFNEAKGEYDSAAYYYVSSGCQYQMVSMYIMTLDMGP